jgi:HK97 family phage prohead protease
MCPEGRACGNCIFFNEDRQNEDGTKAWCEKWEDFADGGYYCNAWEPKEAQERMKVLANSLIARINTEETMETNNKWLDVARAIALKIDGPQTKEPEVRVNTTQIELRDDTADGMTFSGYASVFNSPSEDLGGFIEYVAPGAFKRSLQSRNEIKLLWNHDTGEPLASLRGGTMQLVEDSRGLKVTATLPQTTRGKDIAVLLRTKVIDSMSLVSMSSEITGQAMARYAPWSQSGLARSASLASLPTPQPPQLLGLPQPSTLMSLPMHC